MKNLLIEIYDLGFDTLVLQKYDSDRDAISIKVKIFKVGSPYAEWQTAPTFIDDKNISMETYLHRCICQHLENVLIKIKND